MVRSQAEGAPTVRWLVNIEHVWVALLLGGLVAAAGLLPIAPHDFWWHAAVGREIVATGQIPTVDTFSYTAAGQHFHYQSWLAEVLLALTLQGGGLVAAVWLRVVMLVLTFGALLALCWRLTGGLGRLAVGVTALAVIGSASNWAVRPQLFSLPLFVAELALLWRWRARGGAGTLWPLPLLVGLWANLHGAFVLGLVLPLLVGLGEVIVARGLRPHLWRLAGWSALAALATLLNPRGAGLIGYVWTLLTDPPSQTLIAEWRPPTLATGDGQFFFLLLALGTLLLLWQRRAVGPTEWALWLFFGLLASRGQRYVIWWLLVMAPILATALAAPLRGRLSAPPPPTPQASLLNAVMVAMLGGTALLATPPFKARLPLPPALQRLATEQTPVDAVAAFGPPKGRLFHDMGYGSYLIWAWQGQPPVFVDPRVELYPLTLWESYGQVVAAEPGWEQVLDRWEVQTLLLDREAQAPLVAAAQAAGWRERWGDAHTVILERPNAGESPTTDRG